MGTKLYIPGATKSEYQLTGVGNSILSEYAFANGTRNVAGGHQLKFAAYDKETRKFTLATGEGTGEIGKLKAGMELHLWTCANDDNSPHEIKIAGVDQEARTFTGDRDLEFSEANPATLDKVTEWIAVVPDPNREAAAFAAGDLCFATGDYSFAAGTLTLASGMGAQALGILGEARGDMSVAIGNMARATGLAAFAAGSNTTAKGMFATAIGSGTTAAGDQSFSAGAGAEANGDAAFALGFHTKANARLSYALGASSEANADYSAAFGWSVKTAAKNSLILGRNGELPEGSEYVGAIAIADGDAGKREQHIGLLIQPNKSIPNPLKEKDGEPQTLPEPDFAVTIHGHLLAGTVALPGTSDELDHARAGRWTITPSGSSITPVLKNWRDGDTGELVVNNGSGKISFNSAWHWPSGQSTPELKSSGVDVFTIRQIGENVFIRHDFSA